MATRPGDIDPYLWESMRPEQREIAVHIGGEYRRYYLRGMLAEYNARYRSAAECAHCCPVHCPPA
jgi:hypothetical protein